jgi:DNA-directed RNA polymerase subunit RPC12/RpoP
MKFFKVKRFYSDVRLLIIKKIARWRLKKYCETIRRLAMCSYVRYDNKIHSCRFCGNLDKELFSFTLQVGKRVISTYVCANCMNLVKDLEVTLNICMYCGNIFYINEPSNGEILLIPQCGICERSNCDVKT